MAQNSTQRDLPQLLHEVFGHREFRPHQQKVCEAGAEGRDVLVVMPTGAGKSLCYQLPALARGGTALVISPLIALMDDQATKLESLGLRVARIHSGRPREESRQACRDYLTGELDFLFIAPERMRVPGFPEMLAKRKPALVAIDEAHCISQWGHDFRPDYRTLGQWLPALRPSPIMALTATATPSVQRDIAAQLDLQNPAIFITGFRRDNLAVEVIEMSKPQRADFAAKLLKDDAARPAIVYAGSRKQAEELADKLGRHFPVAAYHAGLDASTRERVQRAFLTGKLEVVVATVAFGMGVDKADVRTVVHVALPGSVEAYYQEIGRAGRDGQPSRTVLLHNFADRKLQEFFLERNYPPTNDLERVARILPPEFTPIDALHNLLRKQKDMMDRETLDRSIEKLLASGLALMDIEGNVRDAGESADGGAWQKNYELQVASRRTQIDRMIRFAESTDCRMRMLVEHFGDQSDRQQSCGICDICNPSAGQASAQHVATDDEKRSLLRILDALSDRATSTGKLFTELRLTSDRKEFDALLDGLARAGLIRLKNDTFTNGEGKEITYRKAEITLEGREPDDRALNTVWIRGTSVSGSKSSSRSKSSSSRSGSAKRAPVDDQEELTGESAETFERLRSWRTATAKPTNTPAFMIVTDSVLRGLAKARPKSLADLLNIHGMGQAKIDRFGAGILAAIRGEHAEAPASKAARPSKPLPSKPVVVTRAEPAAPRPTNAPQARTFPTAKPVATVRQEIRNSLTPKVADLTPEQKKLETSLREWRMERAREAGLPTFFIVSDTALRSIVEAKPSSMDELRSLHGIDREKIERFGADIVAISRA
ncbi:RecQ family ATP-dependent DNA helicase [Granulicella cerasi]|uniref:ATP-dependent DNA helicase RecQ n=1 Tax=Granulicella cerasi TaxID=741063 RepID=A0ABW1Z3G3_9BACT|nr:RecQ family ATP-dependent DNA helicase [Granulicella cerasi]